MRFVVVATMRRGALQWPELLAEPLLSKEMKAELSAAAVGAALDVRVAGWGKTAASRDAEFQRVRTLKFQVERDPEIGKLELDELQSGVW